MPTTTGAEGGVTLPRGTPGRGRRAAGGRPGAAGRIAHGGARPARDPSIARNGTEGAPMTRCAERGRRRWPELSKPPRDGGPEDATERPLGGGRPSGRSDSDAPHPSSTNASPFLRKPRAAGVQRKGGKAPQKVLQGHLKSHAQGVDKRGDLPRSASSSLQRTEVKPLVGATT